MSTFSKLETALRRYGIKELAALWDCSETDASRRVSNERGIRLQDIAEAMEVCGLQVISSDEIIVSTNKFERLLQCAYDLAERDLDEFRNRPKRKSD